MCNDISFVKGISSVLRAAAVVSFCALAASSGAHQVDVRPDPAAEPAGHAPVREIGGRLQVTGETVDVVADTDEPVASSSLATKTDTPLLETPRGVSVVDRKTLDELQAINVSQAHDYVPSFTPQDERGPAFSRGFGVGFYDLRRDGLRTYSWSVRELAAVERVQYLRGPAGVLYGDGSPGGLVNLVLKKPLPVRRHELSLGAGELGFLRVTADSTGPLRHGRGARYRLVAAAEGLGDGFDNDESRVSVLPMLSLDLGAHTTLHLDGEYYDQRGRGYRHVVPATAAAQAGDFSAIPWELNMASPDDRWRGWNASGGLRLDAQLNERASLHVTARYTCIDGDLDVQALAGLLSDGRTAARFLYREKSEWGELQADSFATLALGSGSVRHRLVLGFEAGLSTVDSEIGTAPAPPLDIYEPVYGPRPAEPALAPSGSDLSRLGVYLQDQLSLGGRWSLVPALRVSRLGLEDRSPAARAAPDGGVSDHTAVTPSLGILFRLRPGLSLYASYAEGFEPGAPGQYLEDGRVLDPVESRSAEAGVKVDVLGGQLAVSLAGFGIRQTNVPEADARGFYRQIAAGESRGIEAEIVGSPARGLVVRAGYAWTDAEITDDEAGFSGDRLPNAPEHKANLWTRYRLPGRLERVALAAGVVHVSERFVARDNSVRIPGYTRLDASALIELRPARLELALVAQNFTNARYVTSGAGDFFAGPPRRLAATLTARF
jgi:iron complex outermembrane receptor protein